MEDINPGACLVLFKAAGGGIIPGENGLLKSRAEAFSKRCIIRWS